MERGQCLICQQPLRNSRSSCHKCCGRFHAKCMVQVRSKVSAQNIYICPSCNLSTVERKRRSPPDPVKTTQHGHCTLNSGSTVTQAGKTAAARPPNASSTIHTQKSRNVQSIPSTLNDSKTAVIKAKSLSRSFSPITAAGGAAKGPPQLISLSTPCTPVLESPENIDGRISPLNSSSRQGPDRLKFLDASVYNNRTTVSLLVDYANTSMNNTNKAIAELRSSLMDKLDSITSALAAVPTLQQLIEDLGSRFSAIETQLQKQNSELEKLREGQTSLLRENKFLKEEMKKSDAKMATLSETADSLKNLVQNPCSVESEVVADTPVRRSDGGLGGTGLRSSEIIISGIFKGDVNPSEGAHAVLGTVLPNFDKKDILHVQTMVPGRAVDRCRLDSGKNKNLVRIHESTTRPPPIIVRLSSSSLVDAIMKAKKNINYFHTRDIDRTLLDEEHAPKLVDSKIFINEVLDDSSYREFLKLKVIARNMGFKYVWHCRGVFLVKWRDGKHSHSFSSASDLNAIAKSYLTDQKNSEEV